MRLVRSLAMRTKASKRLTLRDRLSRLSYTAACRLLGPDGDKLIRRGGSIEIDPAEQVTLSEDCLTVRLPDAEVRVALADAAAQRLHVRCATCAGSCVHGGAALAFLLEEKMLLGLAAPPSPRQPVESLDEESLTRTALEELAERARPTRCSACRCMDSWSVRGRFGNRSVVSRHPVTV
jgi:hypothetical protein